MNIKPLMLIFRNNSSNSNYTIIIQFYTINNKLKWRGRAKRYLCLLCLISESKLPLLISPTPIGALTGFNSISQSPVAMNFFCAILYIYYAFIWSSLKIEEIVQAYWWAKICFLLQIRILIGMALIFLLSSYKISEHATDPYKLHLCFW